MYFVSQFVSDKNTEMQFTCSLEQVIEQVHTEPFISITRQFTDILLFNRQFTDSLLTEKQRAYPYPLTLAHPDPYFHVSSEIEANCVI